MTKDMDVTLWRKYKPSDFPNATQKLVQEGPRLADGTVLFPVCRFPYYSNGKPTRRNKYVMYNCFKWKLEWL